MQSRYFSKLLNHYKKEAGLTNAELARFVNNFVSEKANVQITPMDAEIMIKIRLENRTVTDVLIKQAFSQLVFGNSDSWSSFCLANDNISISFLQNHLRNIGLSGKVVETTNHNLNHLPKTYARLISHSTAKKVSTKELQELVILQMLVKFGDVSHNQSVHDLEAVIAQSCDVLDHYVEKLPVYQENPSVITQRLRAAVNTGDGYGEPRLIKEVWLICRDLLLGTVSF